MRSSILGQWGLRSTWGLKGSLKAVGGKRKAGKSEVLRSCHPAVPSSSFHASSVLGEGPFIPLLKSLTHLVTMVSEEHPTFKARDSPSVLWWPVRRRNVGAYISNWNNNNACQSSSASWWASALPVFFRYPTVLWGPTTSSTSFLYKLRLNTPAAHQTFSDYFVYMTQSGWITATLNHSTGRVLLDIWEQRWQYLTLLPVFTV